MTEELPARRRGGSRAAGVARSHPRVVIATAAVLVAGLGTGLGVSLSAPGVPQWCGPVLAELQIRGGSHQTLEGIDSVLTRIERQDAAPVGKLLWDMQAQAHSPGSYVAVNAVELDLESLNRACGQPSSAVSGEVM